jgi:glycine/serine hydroxymethyltransferase
MASFYEKTQALAARAERNSAWRQTKCFNLIPSESTPSLLVKMCEIADPAGRYAEHRTMKGEEVYFYQGIDFIRDVEAEAQRELERYFGCTDVELRPVSGQMANEIVFKGLVKYVNRGKAEHQPSRRLRLVMNNDLIYGGHLSSQPMGALFNFVEEDPQTGKERVRSFPVLKENPYKADLQKLGELLDELRPELFVFGKSMFLYREPVKFVADIVRGWKERPILMYDMAHVLGLYGAFQAPFAEGADVVTGSTHKTFFGTQRGCVAGNFPKDSPIRSFWLDIRGRAFPGSTSNHHLGTLLGLLMAAYEMNEFKDAFQAQVMANAKAFARSLKSHGIPVEGDEADGFTETHQVLIRVKTFGPGMEIARRLEDNNVLTNYQALPGDATFLESSGVRLGVQEMTRFGMREKDFDTLAGLMADIIVRNEKAGGAVAAFRQNFLTMGYCLPPEQALPLAARILASAVPGPGTAGLFAEHLRRVVESRRGGDE